MSAKTEICSTHIPANPLQGLLCLCSTFSLLIPYAPRAVFEAVNHSKGHGYLIVRISATLKGFLNTACVYTVGCPWVLFLFMLVGML